MTTPTLSKSTSPSSTKTRTLTALAVLGLGTMLACGGLNTKGSYSEEMDETDEEGDWNVDCLGEGEMGVDGPPGLDIVSVTVRGTGGETVVTLGFAGNNQEQEDNLVNDTSYLGVVIELESGTWIDARLIEGGAKVSDGLAGVSRSWTNPETLVFTFDGFSTSQVVSMNVSAGRYDFANGDFCDQVQLMNTPA